MYRVEMKNGAALEVVEFAGGNAPRRGGPYQVHGYDRYGQLVALPQREIARVIDQKSGQLFADFGDYLLDAHPGLAARRDGLAR